MFEESRAPKYEKAPSLAESLVFGAGVSAGIYAAALGSPWPVTPSLIWSAGQFARIGPVRELVRPFDHLGRGGAAGVAGLEYVNRQADTGGAAIEAAYNKQPTMLTVSGGPGSQVSFAR